MIPYCPGGPMSCQSAPGSAPGLPCTYSRQNVYHGCLEVNEDPLHI
ncbi:unnamed protein product, partial [Staurois parvus]